MGWRTLGVLGAGCVLEGGCLMVWALSPRLTQAYNPDYTQAFFARLPLATELLQELLGVLSPLEALPASQLGMVLSLEAGLLVMSAGYLLGLLALGAEGGRSGGWLVMGFSAVFRLTMACLPGPFSTDIFSYVMYGRIAAVYGQNPYVQVPNEFPSDPFLGWVFPFWRDQPTVYGPLWTDVSWLLSTLTGGLSNFDQVLVYRFSLIGLELVLLGLLWRLLGWMGTDGGSPAARIRAFALFAWNPLVLFDLVGSTHNDVFMLTLLLVGLAAVARGGLLAGSGALTLSGLVKFTTGVVALFWSIAYAAQGGSSLAKRLGRLLSAWSLALVLAALTAWPWVGTPHALAALGDAAGGRLVLNSAPDLVALTIADQILVPNGRDKDSAEADARFWVRLVTRVAFGAYIIWEVGRLWRVSHAAADADTERRRVLLATIQAATRALLVLPLLVFTWVWSWYFSWSLVLAALLGWRARLCWLVVAYTLVALPIVYAHQYLNDELSGGFVLLLAFGPLTVLFVPGGGYSGSQRPTAQPQPVPAGER